MLNLLRPALEPAADPARRGPGPHSGHAQRGHRGGHGGRGGRRAVAAPHRPPVRRDPGLHGLRPVRHAGRALARVKGPPGRGARSSTRPWTGSATRPSSPGWPSGWPAAAISRRWPVWRCTAWWRARWCPTRGPGPKGWGSGPTSAWRSASERLLIVLVAAGLTGLGVPYVLAIGLVGAGAAARSPSGSGCWWCARRSARPGRRRRGATGTGTGHGDPARRSGHGGRLIQARGAQARGTVAGLKDRLADAAYGLGWKLVCRLPESWARWAVPVRRGHRLAAPGPAGADAGGQSAPGARPGRRPARNSARCPGQAMRSYARYWLEVFRLPVISAERIIAGMHSVGEEKLLFDNLAARPRGHCRAAAHGQLRSRPARGSSPAGCRVHHGGGAAQARVGVPPVRGVPRRPRVWRCCPATGGSSRFGVLAQRLRAGGLVCLVVDRDVTGGGIEVEFFGEKARMMAGAGGAGRADWRRPAPGHAVVRGRRAGQCNIHEEIPVPAEGTGGRKSPP